MNIKLGDLRNTQIIKLLTLHHEDMLTHSPVKSVHALDLSALQKSNITFWACWIDDNLAGCAAVKELNASHGEIKSMRTSNQYLRKGVAAKLLAHIINQARERGYKHLSLETGAMAVFKPAHKLYQQFGFRECPPFADYQLDPYSIFMTKDIDL